MKGFLIFSISIVCIILLIVVSIFGCFGALDLEHIWFLTVIYLVIILIATFAIGNIILDYYHKEELRRSQNNISVQMNKAVAKSSGHIQKHQPINPKSDLSAPYDDKDPFASYDDSDPIASYDDSDPCTFDKHDRNAVYQ